MYTYNILYLLSLDDMTLYIWIYLMSIVNKEV